MHKVISFEGIPGVGTSTLVKNLSNYLNSLGIKTTSISELDLIDGSKTDVMNLVMDVFTYSHDRFLRQFDPFIDTYLAQAVRYLICREVIDKYLHEYNIILEDRGVDTYYSYALAGLKMVYCYPFEYSLSLLSSINDVINNTASLTIRLKDNIKNCVERSILRGSNSVSFKDVLFVTEVDKAYDFLSKVYKTRIINIDVNNCTQEKVLENCLLKLSGVGVDFKK